MLAALQGKLKTFSIMDDANAHDPISGKIMNRYNMVQLPVVSIEA